MDMLWFLNIQWGTKEWIILTIGLLIVFALTIGLKWTKQPMNRF